MLFSPKSTRAEPTRCPPSRNASRPLSSAACAKPPSNTSGCTAGGSINQPGRSGGFRREIVISHWSLVTCPLSVTQWDSLNALGSDLSFVRRKLLMTNDPGRMTKGILGADCLQRHTLSEAGRSCRHDVVPDIAHRPVPRQLSAAWPDQHRFLYSDRHRACGPGGSCPND